jgi:hypothetical protein
MNAHQPFWSLRLSAAAIILSSSITICLAGNFTPVPKNKIAQGGCALNCQVLFNQCLQLCGSNCFSTSSNRLPVSRNCDVEQIICLQGCRVVPGG